MIDAGLLLLCLMLGHDRYTVRERAQEQLAKLGPLAIPALQIARETGEPELRARAAQLLDAQFETIPEPPEEWPDH